MVGGQALLALVGPVGWTIGGIAVAGGALWAKGQNEKAARQVTEYTLQVETEIGKLKTADAEVNGVEVQSKFINGATNGLDHWEEIPCR
jgi:hypothetical protein